MRDLGASGDTHRIMFKSRRKEFAYFMFKNIFLLLVCYGWEVVYRSRLISKTLPPNPSWDVID